MMAEINLCLNGSFSIAKSGMLATLGTLANVGMSVTAGTPSTKGTLGSKTSVKQGYLPTKV